MPDRPLATLESMVGESVRVTEGLRVEAGKVEEFARAVHDANPIHRDVDVAAERGFDARPAPLTFTRTAYFPRYRPPGVDSVRPFDLGFRDAYVLHGEQEYVYERPLVVGDVVSGTATLAEIYRREGRRGGTMTFAVVETEYRDTADALVLTERHTAIETDGPTTDDGDAALSDGGRDPSRDDRDSGETATEGVAVGDAVFGPVVEDVGRSDFVRYAGASGDFNPVHYDEPYATGAGHPSVFAHGMFTAGLVAGLASDWFGLPNVRRLRIRFRDRVSPGDTVRTSGEATDDDGNVTADLRATVGGRTVASGDVEADLSEVAM